MKPQKYYNISYNCPLCGCVTNIIKSNYEKPVAFVCPCGSVDTEKTETETEWSKTGRN